MRPRRLLKSSFERRGGDKLKQVPHVCSIACNSSGESFSLPREFQIEELSAGQAAGI